MESLQNLHCPIKILRSQTVNLLSDLLNPSKLIHTTEGLPRYWRGLAELCGIETYKISNLEGNSNPTKEILKIWQANTGTEATIWQLMSHLKKLDRFDIIDDLCSLIADDIHLHSSHLDYDKNMLLADNIDITERYDAFLLFADEDIDFAMEIIEKMEKQYNLKLCIKDRDLLGGTFEHMALIKLISEKCEKLIVILSPSFFTSPVNKFFLNFTQAISLENRKIIPCLYKYCPDMPPEIRCYFMLDYTKPRVFFNFWDKLYESIRITEVTAESVKGSSLRQTTSQRDTEISLVLNMESNTQMSSRQSDMNQITQHENQIRKSETRDEKTKQKNWFQKFLHINRKKDHLKMKEKKSVCTEYAHDP